MLGEYTVKDNVRVVLSASITNIATSINVTNASGMFHTPPDPTGDTSSNGFAIATLVDSLVNPTVTEIITYKSVTNNGDGTSTLGTVARGQFSTTGTAFAAGAYLIQSHTAAQNSHGSVTYNKATSTLAAPNLSLSGTLGVTGASTLAAVSATSAAVSGNATVGGTLGVTGASTLAAVNATSVGTTGNATIGGTLGVTGATSLGTTSTGQLTSSTIHATSNTTLDGTLTVGGNAISGVNSGDVTLAAVGSTPGANGASVAGQVLTLQPADATHPGVVSAAAQAFSGAKTFDALNVAAMFDAGAPVSYSLTAASTATWYRIGALPASGGAAGYAQEHTVYVGITGNGAQSFYKFRLFKSTTGTGTTCDYELLGAFSTVNSIIGARVVDGGTNGASELDVQFGTTAGAYTVSVYAESRSARGSQVFSILNPAASQGTTAAGTSWNTGPTGGVSKSVVNDPNGIMWSIGYPSSPDAVFNGAMTVGGGMTVGGTGTFATGLSAPNIVTLFAGDGSDGAMVANGTNTFAFATLVGSTYTLLRDVYLSSFSISSGKIFNTAGFRVFCSGNFDASNASAGAITCGTGGTIATNTISQGGGAGTNGGTTGTGSGGTAGNAPALNFGNSNGGAGGSGGAGNTTGGGNAGSGGTCTNPYNSPRGPNAFAGNGYFGGGAGGAGGGGGGGDGAGGHAGGAGGNGGSGGATLCLFTNTLTTNGSTAAGAISASGANGANGGSPTLGNCGSGGGGGGGGGGEVYIGYFTRSGAAVTNLIKASGGNAGIAGTKTGTGVNGSSGVPGQSGQILSFNLTTGAVSAVAPGTAGVGTTGGISQLTL